MLKFRFKPRHPITRVAFTAAGEVVTAQPHVGVSVRDRMSGEPRHTFRLERAAAIHALAVRPDFGFISAHTDRGGEVYHPAGTTPFQPFLSRWNSVGSTLARLTAHLIAPVNADSLRVAVSADGRVAFAVKFSGVPQLLPFEREVVVQVNSPLRARHVRYGQAVVAFSPDGGKLAVGDGETLSVFDLDPVRPLFDSTERQRATISPLFTLERPDPEKGSHADRTAEHWLPPVTFDHSSRSLFTLGLRNRVRRIDLATGGVMAEWGWRCEPIRSLAVSPDGSTAAAGCRYGELVVWDLE